MMNYNHSCKSFMTAIKCMLYGNERNVAVFVEIIGITYNMDFIYLYFFSVIYSNTNQNPIFASCFILLSSS